MPYTLAFDIETPNGLQDRICAISWVKMLGLRVAERGSVLIDPECGFDEGGIRAQGVDAAQVLGAPHFDAFWSRRGDLFLKAEAWVLKNKASVLSVLEKTLKAYGLWNETIEQTFSAVKMIEAFAWAQSAWPSIERYDFETLAKLLEVRWDARSWGKGADVCAAIFLQTMVEGTESASKDLKLCKRDDALSATDSVAKTEGEATDAIAPSEPLHYGLAIHLVSPNRSESSICAIGWAKIASDRVIESGQIVINPNRKLDAQVLAWHGLSPELLKDQPSFLRAWEPFEPIFYGAEYIVVHHAATQLRLLTKEMRGNASVQKPVQFFDSCFLANELILPHISLGLASLSKHFRIYYKNWNAQSDAGACAKIFLALNKAYGPLFYKRSWFDLRGILEERLVLRVRETGPSAVLKEFWDLLKAASKLQAVSAGDLKPLMDWIEAHPKAYNKFPCNVIARLFQTLRAHRNNNVISPKTARDICNRCFDPLFNAPSWESISLDKRPIACTRMLADALYDRTRPEWLPNSIGIHHRSLEGCRILVVDAYCRADWLRCDFDPLVIKALLLQASGEERLILGDEIFGT